MSSPDRSPADLWQRLQTLLLSTEDLTEFLAELAELGASVMSPAASCGITTRYDGRPVTVASSDERAVRLDEHQYAGGEGPCLYTLESGQTVSVPDFDNDSRWSTYARYARQQGLRCSLSVPLTADGSTVGAMNFYIFHSAMAFDFARQNAAATFAAQASGALELSLRHARNNELVEQLQQALESRSVIDQAMGILMVTERCSAADAFALLRRRSQSSQRRLRVVAAELVDEVDRTGRGEPGP